MRRRIGTGCWRSPDPLVVERGLTLRIYNNRISEYLVYGNSAFLPDGRILGCEFPVRNRFLQDVNILLAAHPSGGDVPGACSERAVGPAPSPSFGAARPQYTIECWGMREEFVLAGVLAERLILNHPFIAHNKLIALVAMEKFLNINGYIFPRRKAEVNAIPVEALAGGVAFPS